MDKMINILGWFMGISAVSIIILGSTSFGYFWLIILGVSLFLGLRSGKKIEIVTKDQQLNHWFTQYNQASYCQKQQLLDQVVREAVANQQPEKAIEFLKYILAAEPDNELAHNLMVSIWGSEIIGDYVERTS